MSHHISKITKTGYMANPSCEQDGSHGVHTTQSTESTLAAARIVDPDPYWILIQEPCGSGSVSQHVDIG